MAKVAFEVDRSKLEAAVERVEQNGPLRTRSLLYEAVMNAYNADNPPRPVTVGVVSLRLGSWNIPMKTPIGQRGRPKKVETVTV